MIAWAMLRGGIPVLPGVVGMMVTGFLIAIGIQMAVPDWFEVVRSFFGSWGMLISEFQMHFLWPFAEWVHTNIPSPLVNEVLGVYLDIQSRVEPYFYFGRMDSHTFIGGFTIFYFAFELFLFGYLAVRIKRKEGRILELQQGHEVLDHYR
ncbi:MAG: hypothetical protein SWN10_23780 [Pseudomonadota bacterium]|nr:hypothetical protein [Pseudomonadota bacterium]